MKRFLTVAVLLLALVLGAYWAVFYGGFYLPIGDKENISVPFRANGKTLEIYNGGGYDAVKLRGVDMSASMPCHYAAAYDASEGDYLRWLEYIGDMGANAVRVTSVMDDDFYNALYKYNEEHDSPIYLLQGMGLDDYTADSSEDAYSDAFLGALIRDGRDLVDIIHGRKNLTSVGTNGGGTYRRDISRWVVGFLIGTQWYPDTVVYTNNGTVHTGEYSGDYFRTADGARPFEAAMAQIMDNITQYETDKYGSQHPVGFICDEQCDFLEYEEVYARQLGKYARIDPELVLPTENMKAGRFAAYRLFEFCDTFSERLSRAQMQEIAPYLAGLDTSEPYGGYLGFLSKYHTMPIIAAGYGFSSARGAAVMNEAPLTEREQGEKIAQISRTLENDGWSGGFISTWQDEWERRSWNTAFASVPTENYMWHDLQTVSQSSGLMAFEPPKEQKCTIDGDKSEWRDEDVLLENGALRLSARYDAEGIYLLLEGVSENTAAYLPIDLSDEAGSRTSEDLNLSFSKDADFILCIDGKTDSRLLVQERYDAMRERFLYETEGVDQFVYFPPNGRGVFAEVKMAVQNMLLVDTLTPDTRAQQRLGTYGTGRLTYGSGDKNAQDYNTLADFCFGENCAEIRIPWLLLNVGNPSEMLVHRDYYEHNGVEFKKIREIYIGAALKGQTGEIELAPFAVRGWNGLSYTERLKDSYYVMKKCWKG